MTVQQEEIERLRQELAVYRTAFSSIRLVLGGVASGDSEAEALIAIARVLGNSEKVLSLQRAQDDI